MLYILCNLVWSSIRFWQYLARLAKKFLFFQCFAERQREAGSRVYHRNRFVCIVAIFQLISDFRIEFNIDKKMILFFSCFQKLAILRDLGDNWFLINQTVKPNFEKCQNLASESMNLYGTPYWKLGQDNFLQQSYDQVQIKAFFFPAPFS